MIQKPSALLTSSIHMPADTTASENNAALHLFLLSLADDELVLGHRDSEWTGHAPIIEEDIAFSNIAQDEMGHSLVWYSLLESLTGKTPDRMAFERDWRDFVCCRFVAYPRGDFAYTAMRQFLFDEAERVRLQALTASSHPGLRDVAGKLLSEEQYHLIHSRGLVERLGDATEESSRRMQDAVSMAFPQALGIFEIFEGEHELITRGIFPGNHALRNEWLDAVMPVLDGVSLRTPVKRTSGGLVVDCTPDDGGRRKSHTPHLKQLLDDLQQVYRSIPGASW